MYVKRFALLLRGFSGAPVSRSAPSVRSEGSRWKNPEEVDPIETSSVFSELLDTPIVTIVFWPALMTFDNDDSFPIDEIKIYSTFRNLSQYNLEPNNGGINNSETANSKQQKSALPVFSQPENDETKEWKS